MDQGWIDFTAELELEVTEGSVMHHVDKLTGKLLLVHGMIDENVHFRHTARIHKSLTTNDHHRALGIGEYFGGSVHVSLRRLINAWRDKRKRFCALHCFV